MCLVGSRGDEEARKSEEKAPQTDGAACTAWRCDSIYYVQDIKSLSVCSEIRWGVW